jgi:hypothetical protein
MGRKHYSTKQARRRNVVQYVPVETQADYSVTLTNGSGFTNIVVTGTPVSAWNWSTRAGANGGVKPGKWWPVAIKKVGDTEAIFTAI